MDAHVNDSRGHRVDVMGEIAEELAAGTEYGKAGGATCLPWWASLNRRLAALQRGPSDSEDG